jgi:hypothetical protein
MSAAAPFCRFVIDYSALVATLCERTEQLELSRLELDRIAGLPTGYAGKILSKEPVKTIGLHSLGPVLQSLGLVLCVLEDPAARDRTLARRTPFDASNRRVGNSCNPKKSASDCALPAPAVESPQPAQIAPRSTEQISRSHLRVVQPRVKGAGRWGGSL